MNSKQINKLAMYVTVNAVIDQAENVWKDLPGFADSVVAFREALDEIKLLGAVEQAPVGAVALKKGAFEAMANIAYEVAAATRVCARRSGDVVLAARARFSRTALGHGRGARVLDRCRDIHGLVAGGIPLVADYGVTAEKIGRLKAAIDLCEALQSRPREVLASASAARKRRQVVYREVDRILEDLDALCVQFHAEHSRFCDELATARVVVDFRATRAAQGEMSPQPQVTAGVDQGSVEGSRKAA